MPLQRFLAKNSGGSSPRSTELVLNWSKPVKDLRLLMISVPNLLMNQSMSSLISRRLAMTQARFARLASFATLLTPAHPCRPSLRSKTSRPVSWLRSISTKRCRSTIRPIWQRTNLEINSTSEGLVLTPCLITAWWLLEAELDANQDACWETSDDTEQVSSRLRCVFDMCDLPRVRFLHKPSSSLHLPLERLNGWAGEFSMPLSSSKNFALLITRSTLPALFYFISFSNSNLHNLTLCHSTYTYITCLPIKPIFKYLLKRIILTSPNEMLLNWSW